MVADFNGTYHAILGRPALTKFIVVPHYSYLVLKMPTKHGVLTLRGNVYTAYTCEEIGFKVAKATDLSICMEQTLVTATKTPANHLEIPELQAPCKSIKSKDHKEIQLVDDDSSKTTLIGANLDPKYKDTLIRFLRDNISVFAWKPADMPGVPRHLIEHSLIVLKTAKPIKQKLRWFAHDKKEAIRVEVTWLLVVGFIKEVYHPEWLANPVLVHKKNNEWRMCVNYTDLNKHCPKDPFSLSCIDEVVDSTAGCELLSFLDCYSGYHQIALNKDDQIKTSFITPFGAYCYMTMPFRLKNARATYQRAIQNYLQTR
jgi:hypothetical protein